ncbi:MAG: hypothetical protein GXY58_11175 [Planctomycetaceae bacterium]|nr:hypothetical protein [Planctomycetaceae bacterium]
MDARLLRASLMLAVVWIAGVGSAQGVNHAAVVRTGAVGGSCRSQNFVVTAPTPAFARQVCEAAEHYRRVLAVEWLGAELPPWQDVCPIRVLVGPQLGAGGATTFTFIDGQPRHWDMEIQGSQERILDSVLPHEITHTIFATHFGCPLPRWADEGGATSVEHVSERSKQDQLLIQFLTSNRGIAFNQMFAMRDYPPDILPLYSQGYSLARYLIAQGGRRKYVDYVSDGLRWNNWTASTQKHYGFRSLSELQVSWLDWVRQGSPEIQVPASAPVQVLTAAADSARQGAGASGDNVQGVALDSADSASRLVPLPARVASRSNEVPLDRREQIAASDPHAPAAQDGWYMRERDRALSPAPVVTTDLRPAAPPSAAAAAAVEQRRARPGTPAVSGQAVRHWAHSDHPTGTLLR